MKRTISILLTLVFILSALPLAVFADNTISVTEDGFTWTLDKDTMILTISGEGEMPERHRRTIDKNHEEIASYFYDVKKVIIEEGITSIGDSALENFRNMEEVVIPSTVERIESSAFEHTIKLESIVFPANLKYLDIIYSYGTCWCKTMIFTGDIPEVPYYFELDPLNDDSVKIYYPEENPTWTEDAKLAFGSNILWNGEVASDKPIYEIMTDVKEHHWYVHTVQYVYSRGLMTGTSADKFSPNAWFTRAQMVQILFNMSGENKSDYMGKSVFDDVDALAWYAPAVNWAVENNITSGVSKTEFAPNRNITRQELTRFFFVYADYIDSYYATPRAEIDAPDRWADFTDTDEIADWAYESMSWAIAVGIISGMSVEEISPRTTATRAQAAQMLKVFDEYIKENKRITTGAFRTLADYIAENGKLGGGYWPDAYTYSYTVGDMRASVDYLPSIDSITLYVCGENYSEHLFVGAHANCMEQAALSIWGLDSEYEFSYTYFPMGENDNTDIISNGVFAAEGYRESELCYGDYIYGDYFSEGYYLNNEEYTEFATQKRDTAVMAMQTFIDHLLTGCGLERTDLFITK